MEWFYVQDGDSVGPLDEGEFKALAAAGKITPETLVWHEGMPEWVALSSLNQAPAAGDTPAAAPAAESTPAEAEPTAPAPAAAEPQRAGLKLKGKEEAGAGPEGAPAGDAAHCCECGREFPVNGMIQYEGSYVCAECKPTFFQRVREGADGVVTGGMGETPNADLTAMARQSLSGNWGLAIGLAVVYSMVVGAVSFLAQIIGMVIPLGGNVISLLLTPPLQLGRHMVFLDLSRNADAEFGRLFNGFSKYGPSIGVYFFTALFASLPILPGVGLMIPAAIGENQGLMVIGGIVMFVGAIFSVVISFMLAMAMYIIADDQQVTSLEALKLSRTMMQGMKWKLFCLNFRFVGWTLLAVFFTLGIGMLWVTPYLWTATCGFYDDVKGRVTLS